MTKRFATTVALNLGLTVVYVGVAIPVLNLGQLNPSASAVWPPAGIAIAALLSLGYRLWPGVFLGALLINFIRPTHPLNAIMFLLVVPGFALGNTLEAVIAAWLTRRFARGMGAFDHAGSLFRYALLAAFPATLLCAVIGVALLCIIGIPQADILPVFLTWWTGDFVSALVVTPLLIVCFTTRWSMPTPLVMLEATVLCLLIIVVNEVIFCVGGDWGFAGERPHALAFLSTPLLLWAAYRFQQRGAVIAAAIMSVIAVQGTIHHTGPFAASNPNDALLYLQLYIGVNALTALTLAALVAEARRADCEKQEHLEREQTARAQAELANRVKDEFLAVLSHELRTPLMPVMLTASMIERDTALPERFRADIRQIRHNVELEARLIDDLLDLTRVARGKMHLTLQPTGLHQKIAYAADIFATRRGDITLDLAAASNHVMGDAARLQQIFWNLLSNAVKFTPAGKPIIVRTSNPTPDSIQVQVTDAGIGIDAAFLPQVFHAFQQGHPTEARKQGGLGLGLTITRALVEGHNGSITAASPGPNQGATFTVTLPTIALPEPAPFPETPAPARQTSLRILLVEDHEPTVNVMTRLLKALGHTVTAAGCVSDALASIHRSVPDLLVSDIGLPDATGYDLLHKIRSDACPAISELKAIAVSGYGMDQDIDLSLQAGFSAHLTKPIDFEQLETAILNATQAQPRVHVVPAAAPV